MSYESPIITTAIQDMSNAIVEAKDNMIIAKVQETIGIDVDKGELLRALAFDREQYQAGYRDGKAEREADWIVNGDEMKITCGNCKETFAFEDVDDLLNFLEGAKYCITCGSHMNVPYEYRDDE